jgi:carbamoyl-phosphate synthase large subunit
LKPDHVRLLRASLGRPEMYDAALLKTRTLRLARSLGVRTPECRTVATPEAALAAADELGYPVHLKTSFSWAGNGVVACRDPRELEAAARGAFRKSPLRGLKRGLRAWLHRDWYPTDSATDVQKTIQGTGAAFNAVALDGRLLAGFATCKARTAYEGGPSTVVRLCANPELTDAAATLIEALGATGFLSFDFMIENETDAAYLIESNPRPAQVGHLGKSVGVDLCAALAAALAGKVETPRLIPSAERTVGLFPLAWLRDTKAGDEMGDALDRPREDPTLAASAG